MGPSKLSAMPFLTDKNNPIGYVVQGAYEFGKDSQRLVQRCTKPDAKEFKRLRLLALSGLPSWASLATPSNLSSPQSTTSLLAAHEPLLPVLLLQPIARGFGQ